MLRSENVNKYVATRGLNWQSDMYLTDDVSLAERFTILPVRTQINPPYMPIANNENINEKDNYVQNGTDCHLLNTQLNFINKVPGINQLITHGNGKRKKGMWKRGDIWQILMKKPFEG